MKTSSKEVKEAIRKYIIENIHTEEYDTHDGTLKTSLEIIIADLKVNAFYPNNLKRLVSYEACFIDYMCGLPSYFNFEYYTKEILELMAGFGLPLPTNKEEEEGVNLFRHLIYREFLYILKQNKLSIF